MKTGQVNPDHLSMTGHFSWALPWTPLCQKNPFSVRKISVRNSGAGNGPAAILFISRDTCSDSIAKLFRACFYGISHNYRAIRCKTAYRTDLPV